MRLTRHVHLAFSPATALMGRLRYARKFALIGLVLLVPAGVALRAYWTQQGAQIAFSAKESVGLDYLEPANGLLVRLAVAQDLAVRAAAGDRAANAELPGARSAALDAVESVAAADRRLGTELETARLWSALRPK